MPLLCTDLDDRNYVSFVFHDCTRLSNSFNLCNPFCKTSTFQASYFNRIVKLWNYVCKLAPPTSFSSPTAFQLFREYMKSITRARAWTLVPACGHYSLHAHATPNLFYFLYKCLSIHFILF